ncbi:hypothetical protein DL768_010385 [Monosporascus sp. mg162]|nr:hypothetical protein DL768_010385 [Monosporascus sp. mg162]
MTVEIPSEQTAIIQNEEAILRITPGLPIPKLRDDQILVKTQAVALNPCDFKMPARFPTPGLWNGCDFAGTVVAIGDEAASQKPAKFRIGALVFGAVQGSNRDDPQSGAYCQYLAADAAYTFKAPDDMLPTTAVAMCGTALATVGMALFQSLRLSGTLSNPVSGKRQETVLVWGGSSSVGLMTIQILKMNALRYVVDPFADIKTMAQCYEAIGRAGGSYCALEKYQETVAATRQAVKPHLVMGSAITGRGLSLPKPYGAPSDAELHSWSLGYYEELQRAMDEERLKPCPIQMIPGGFGGILHGLDMLKNKKVSGKKLIVSLDEVN